MRRTFFLILFLSVFSASKSQEHPIINVGAGWPFFFNAIISELHSNYSIGSNSLNVFIEKPDLFNIAKSKDLYITPGMNYFLFHESGEGGGLGGGSSINSKHQAFSIYSKFIHEMNLKPENSSNIYFGFMAGIYLHSNLSGESRWWRSWNSELRSGTTEFDRNGKPFFNSSYMGVLFGFKPLANKSSFIQPLIEFSFFPNYAIFYDPHKSEDEQKLSRSMAMITVSLGIGNKKSRSKE